MGTQGIVSVVKDGNTIVKAIAGIDGMKAHELASEIANSELDTAAGIFEIAKSLNFGDRESLVVQDSRQDLYEGHSDLSPLYREKFIDPEFNPRWIQGSADHVVVVDLSSSTGPSLRDVCCEE